MIGADEGTRDERDEGHEGWTVKDFVREVNEYVREQAAVLVESAQPATAMGTGEADAQAFLSH